MSPIVATRPLLEPIISDFEAGVDQTVNEKNFQLHFMVHICLGLITSQFRHTSVQCLKNMVKHKLLMNDGFPDKVLKFEYLLLAFLAMSDTAYTQFLKEEFPDNEELQCVTKNSLPKVVIDQIAKNNGETQVALIAAAYIFDCDCDSSFKLKFLRLYNHLFATQRDFALKIFHLVKRGLESNMVSSTSIDLITSITNIMVNVIRDEEYSEATGEAELSAILDEFEFQRVKTIKSFKADVTENECDMKNMNLLQQLMHRSISSIVEGERLEKS